METAYGQIHGIFCEQRPGCHGIHGINVEKFAGRTHEAQSVQDVENLYAGRDCARNRLLLNRLVLNILTMLHPEHSKKSEKISIRRLMLKMRNAPELVIN